MFGDRISPKAVSATQIVNSEHLNPRMSLHIFIEHMEHHCSEQGRINLIPQ